ncbi:MAG: hypothetical protein QM772_12030 [Ottowia sp.]|uniref:hypothetical protein n=1 Tax=Ottowia sp. TaxID=1898956 RepID=UPI0039E36399
MLTSALAGGLTAGLTDLTGLGRSTATASFSQRLIEHTGRATLQGASRRWWAGSSRTASSTA